MRRVNDITVTPDDRLAVSEAGTAEPAELRLPRRRVNDQPRSSEPKRTTMRRRVLPFASRRTRLIGRIAIVLAIIAIPTVLTLTGLTGKAWAELRAWTVDASAGAGLKVQEIYVTGRNRTPADRLIATLGVKRGDPILGLDLVEAKQRLLKLAWVRDVSIERRLPGTVYLSIREREPVALWQHKGEFMLVDREGKPIPGAIDGGEKLLLVVGEDAPVNAASLIETLRQEPELMRRVKAAQRVSGRRWNILLDAIEGGTEVRLPEENADSAWRRLADLEREHGLLKQKLAMIDLRLNDRLVVKSETPPVQETSEPQKKKARGANGKDA